MARINPAGWLLWIALVATISGARLWLISVFATGLPIHDQWDAEAAHLFKPWLEGHLRWSDLFNPHNEHRIVLSRLLALGLLRLNGQWDAQLEMTANAVLCAMIGLAVVAAAWRFLSRRNILYVAAATILWLGLPYAQENTLWGFQSCFYFMLIFSLATIWGLGFHRPFSLPWWFGGLSAVLACFSMASGVLAAFVVFMLAGIRSVTQRTWGAERTATALLVGLVLVLAFLLHHEFPAHAALKAQSALAWAKVFGRALAWPFCDNAALSLLMYGPLGWLAIQYLFRTRGTSDPHAERRQAQTELLLAVGLWVMLQAAAIAFSRGADGTEAIASRYMDILALGALVNGGAVVVLLAAAPRRKILILPGSVWIGAVIVGAGLTSYREASGQAGRQAYLRSEEENVRAYVATGDRKYLEGDPPPRIPYPDPARLAVLLDDPSIREILPAAVRLPLPVNAEVNPEGSFTLGGYPPEVMNAPHERTWGSYSEQRAAARGSMQSSPLRSRLSHLRIELAGFLREGMSLDVRSTTTNEQLRFIPTTQISASWRAGLIAVPTPSFTLLARDQNPQDWFAFREPREIGRYSLYAERLIAKGPSLCLLGVACLLAAFLQRALNGITKRRKT